MSSFRLCVVLCALLIMATLAGTDLGTSIAKADSIWVQSYERPSESAPCLGQPDETPWQASWGTDSSWKPSWELWANAGLGGWVCSRSITWAKSTPPPEADSTVPTSVTATAGDASATVSWAAPASDDGSPITSYTATAVEDASKSCTTPDGVTLSCVVTGLTNGTSYSFTVTATSSDGTSDPSAPSVPVTPSATAVVPGTPTSVTATAGDASASVSWTAPASDGGSLITSYTATAVEDGSKSCTTPDGSTLTCTVSGLTNGTSYSFTVRARNSVGPSAASSPSASVTPILPCANGGVCVAGDIGPGGGLVFLVSGGDPYEMAPNTWAVESKMDWCNDISTDITGATGTAMGTGAANTAAMDVVCSSGAGQSAADYAGGGLTDWYLPSKSELAAMYDYSISPGGTLPALYDFDGGAHWTSSQRDSTETWVMTMVIGGQYSTTKGNTNVRVRPIRSGFPGLPGAPTSVVASAGDESAAVSWTAPASDGGYAITSYTATAVEDGSKSCTTTDGSTLTCTVSGLTNGTSYSFTVRATTGAGTSVPSVASSSVTPTLSCANGGVCALGDIGPGGGLVFLVSGAVAYEMAPNTWAVESKMDWCNDTSTSIPGATGTAVGTGAANTAAMDVVCTSGAGQSATDYAGGGLTDWYLPSKNELAAMYDYSTSLGVTIPDAYVFGGGAHWSSSQRDATEAWVMTLDIGGQYSTAKSNTNVRARPIREVSLGAPGTPTAVLATAGDASVLVSWTAPTSNGGAPITSYTATAVEEGSKSCTTSDGSTLSCTVTGLTNGTSYSFTVTATNSAGTSAASSPSSSVTPTLSCANGGVCVAGDIGPGGGLVFLISSGLAYEMAPASWAGSPEPKMDWCDDTSTDISGATGTAVGTGAANTAAMDAVCSSGAGQSAADYAGGGLTDWYLPSKDELAAMYDYSVTSGVTIPDTYVFGGGAYWSSSQRDAAEAWVMTLEIGGQYSTTKGNTNVRARPIRVGYPGPPSAPTSALASAGDTSASVSWTAPVSDGGYVITSYTATAVEDGAKSCTTGDGSTLTCTVSGLANGTSYSFTVEATNSAGTSPASAASSPVTPVGVPGAPTAVLATASDASASVSWTAPASTGGAAITSYTATAVEDGSKSCTTADGSTLSCSVSGLTNGTSYSFTVTATNSAGTSVASAASSSVTPVLSCANGGACVLGDIGPGGGLVFLISGGVKYEMAPKTWLGPSETKMVWCNDTTTAITGATGTAVGTGAANTAAMDAACTSGAGQSASDYAGGGKTDWFLPARSELAAMYDYSVSPGVTLPDAFVFGSGNYWSSSQRSATQAWAISLTTGGTTAGTKSSTNIRERPIRSF